jgi:hypothetical protein
MHDKYYKKSKDEMIQDYLNSIKKDDIIIEEDIEIKKEKPKRIRDVVFPNILEMNKKELLIYLSMILFVAIVLLVVIKTQSAMPEFDKYHEDNKYLIQRTDFFDDGDEFKLNK